MPTVSIIVSCYNSAAFVSATVDSVLAQTQNDWELHLVDDGSKDDTGKIIENYARLDSRVFAYRKDNSGAAHTRNYGFDQTDPDAPYVIFLDHDDLLQPHALTRLCDYMDSHPEVGLLSFQFEYISAQGDRLGTGHRSRWRPGWFGPHWMRDREILTPFVTFFCATGQGPFALYRRSVYIETEGWETRFWPHEDTDMFCQMALRTTVHALPDRLYLKRILPNQGLSDHARIQRSYRQFRKKWGQRFPRNAHEAALLSHARIYYRTTHRPLRDVKTAYRRFQRFLKQPTVQNLRLVWLKLSAAFRGFVILRTKLLIRSINRSKSPS